jgi:hypothetical protein
MALAASLPLTIVGTVEGGICVGVRTDSMRRAIDALPAAADHASRRAPPGPDGVTRGQFAVGHRQEVCGAALARLERASIGQALAPHWQCRDRNDFVLCFCFSLLNGCFVSAARTTRPRRADQVGRSADRSRPARGPHEVFAWRTTLVHVLEI